MNYWLLCFAVAALTFAAAMGLILLRVLRRKSSSLWILWPTVCICVSTYALWLPIFLSSDQIGCPDAFSALVADFINVLQVISLDAGYGYTGYFEWIGLHLPQYLTPFYTGLFGPLHILLPTLIACTAVTVLLRCFSALRLLLAQNSRKPVFVFSQMNTRSLCFAESLRNRRCKIVFCGADDSSFGNERESQRRYILTEDPITELDLKHRNRKEVYYLLIDEDEDRSLGDALRLIERFHKESREIQEHIHIFHFSRNDDYSVLLDSAGKESLDVQSFHESEILAYNLLDSCPICSGAGDGHIHVLLHGLCPVNEAFLKAAAWCGQLEGCSLEISVVGVNIQDRIEAIRLAAPGLFSVRYHIRFFNCSNESEALETVRINCKDANYIVVSEPSDNEVMETGIQLRRLFYRVDPEYKNCPPIFCCISDPAKQDILKALKTAETNPKRKVSYGLTPFGCISEVYTYENIVDSPLEQLAKNVHLAYEEIFSAGEIQVSDAIRGYHTFEVNKRSNRANALHIRYKLASLGLDYSDDPEKEEVSLDDYLDEMTLERLAVTEHNRWMAFLESEGWSAASREDVDAYRASGLSRGRHNCPLLKMHPYICEFEKLLPLSMALEGKDTTVYDRELITRIPDIVGNKWGLPGRKYRIVKQ